MTAQPRLIVLRALGLGDYLTGLPAMRALQAAFGEHHHLVAAPNALSPLAELAGWTLIPYELTDNPPAIDSADIAVNLHGKGPQSHRALLPLQAGTLIAFGHEEVSQSRDFPVHVDDEHEVHRWCRLLDEFGIPADPARLDLDVLGNTISGDGEIPASAEVSASGATVIHPGAASGARRWPPERWSQVAIFEKDRGRTVILTGSRTENELCETIRIRAALPSGANLAGRTSLISLARIVSAARLALSSDTGFAHLATAVGTPSVVLFGPVSPELWGPPKDRPQHRAIWKGMAGDPHGDHPHRGLLEITVADVTAAIEDAVGAPLSRT